MNIVGTCSASAAAAPITPEESTDSLPIRLLYKASLLEAFVQFVRISHLTVSERVKLLSRHKCGNAAQGCQRVVHSTISQ